MPSPRMVRDAVLYLAGPEDVRAGLLPVAGRPVALRVVMAAVRAGVDRVGVPPLFRGTALERAITRTPAARRAVTWLDTEPPPSTRPLLLLPAAALACSSAVAALLDQPATAVLAESRGAAPIAVVAPPMLHHIAAALAEGKPVGDALDRLLAERSLRVWSDGWYVHVTGPAAGRRLADRLYAELGTPIDTRVDRLLHRRLSHPVTRAAVRLGIGPNVLTGLGLLVGLAAAGALSRGTPMAALAVPVLYAVAVVLDHADGEVARLTFAESAVGHWLDVTSDTLVHVGLVVAMGAAAVAHGGGAALVLGGVAATGVAASAAVVSGPPRTAPTVKGWLLEPLANRNPFYTLLLTFVLALGLAPAFLLPLLALVALGTHVFWVAYVVGGLVRRERSGRARRPVGRVHPR